ncbi:hypothetical protein E4U27_000893 [Claviceps purpurea]|nr:hypothetical protein E4U27_000893 [Claviceps purpurea]KAG6233407.1 hypothetical protein E4U26_002186 [Claviceps purpurea]
MTRKVIYRIRPCHELPAVSHMSYNSIIIKLCGSSGRAVDGAVLAPIASPSPETLVRWYECLRLVSEVIWAPFGVPWWMTSTEVKVNPVQLAETPPSNSNDLGGIGPPESHSGDEVMK